MSYRQLAQKLDLSVTAVHNRIQNLIELGIIRKFTTRLSLVAKNGIHVLVFGTSRISSMRDLNPKLEKNGLIYWLAVGGGNVLYIGANLRNIAELDSLARFVKEAAGIPEPTVAITTSPVPPGLFHLKIDPTLCELDYKIVSSMKDNSRKPTSQVAEELGVSTKTVRRRLSRMQKNFLVVFSMDWYPDASNDIMSVFHVKLKSEADANAPTVILQKHCPNILFYWGFGNLPGDYLFLAWTPTAKELREIRESLEQEPAVQSVTPNILYTGYIFPTWIDEIP